jgi:hypothetical protein
VSVAESALTAVAALLALPNATGSYVHDLSGTGVVRVGQPDPAQGGPAPAVWLWPGPMSIRYADEMGSWIHEFTLFVHARVPSATSDPLDRAKAGIRLINDLLLALRTNRTLTSTVLDTPASGSAWDGAPFGLDGLVGCDLTLKPWWLATTAEGA